MFIRKATLRDAPDIARLAGELGYPCDAVSMAGRVRKVLRQKRHLLLVAGDDGDSIRGWLHACGADSIESGFRVEIVGRVVSKIARRSGVGRRLVEAAERWAGKIGSELICVRGNVRRRASHPFYRKLGYEPAKIQKVYRKGI